MRKIDSLMKDLEEEPTADDGIESLYDIGEDGKSVTCEEEDATQNGSPLRVSTSGYSNSSLVYNGSSTTWINNMITYPLDNLKDKAIDVDRLKLLDETERLLVMELLQQLDKASQNMQHMIMNTLDMYNIFEDKQILARKRKIKGVL
jgi:hypothetical protein